MAPHSRIARDGGEMKIGEWLKGEMRYGRELADSGWQGARKACDSLLDGERIQTRLTRSAQASWAPAAIGAGVGAACALVATRRRPRLAAVAAMAAAGAVTGLAAGLAWETRQLATGMARGAWRGIKPVRDSRWLERNPVNFG